MKTEKAAHYLFIGFPTGEEQRRLWAVFLNKKILLNLEFAYVCGAHFITGTLEKIL